MTFEADPEALHLTPYDIEKIKHKMEMHQREVDYYQELLTAYGKAKGYTDKKTDSEADKTQTGNEIFDKLPWRSYTTKQAADPEEAAWIFSNTQGAESLVSTLKAKDGKATIGRFEYQLQGPEQKFLARKPVK